CSFCQVEQDRFKCIILVMCSSYIVITIIGYQLGKPCIAKLSGSHLYGYFFLLCEGLCIKNMTMKRHFGPFGQFFYKLFVHIRIITPQTTIAMCDTKRTKLGFLKTPKHGYRVYSATYCQQHSAVLVKQLLILYKLNEFFDHKKRYNNCIAAKIEFGPDIEDPYLFFYLALLQI